MGKIQKTLAYFKIALKSNPYLGQYWLSYNDSLLKLGKLKDVKTLFNQAKN